MMQYFSRKTIAVIVAHPDDETLWAGGTILNHPLCKWYVVCLTRASDIDRAPKFYKALHDLHAEGIMGDLEDGPDQTPLNEIALKQTIIDLLPKKKYDIIITHNPNGEYTKHLRHEEVSKAVMSLWIAGEIQANELRTFAFEDGKAAYMPVANEDASIYRILTKEQWQQKYDIIRKIYGFSELSWEALATPRIEAFWQFSSKKKASRWLEKGGVLENKNSVQFQVLRNQYYKFISKLWF
jgi:LmbE family N-acetylglucosaminyl deacetylase